MTPHLTNTLERALCALQAGRPLPPGVEMHGPELALPTRTGPLYVRRADAEYVLDVWQSRAAARYERAFTPYDVRHLLPRVPAAPPAPKVHRAACFPAEQTYAWKEWSRAHKPGRAPKRAVGNFSTPEARARTLDTLRANLATAQAGGHERLAKVFAEALATATKRGVDPGRGPND